MKINRLDPLCAWVPDWQAKKFGHEFNLIHAMEVSEFLELSAFFECDYVSLNAIWTAGRYSQDEIVGYFRQLCEKAANYHLTCDIEAIPMWGIPHLDDALAIIEKAEMPNAGLVFDTTHFIRGGSSLETLRSIPSDLIHLVQLCDGKIPAELTLEEECFDRMWPGTGDFTIAEMVAVLDEMGALRGVGPEVFSPDYAKNLTPGSWIAEKTQKSLRHYPELFELSA